MKIKIFSIYCLILSCSHGKSGNNPDNVSSTNIGNASQFVVSDASDKKKYLDFMIIPKDNLVKEDASLTSGEYITEEDLDDEVLEFSSQTFDQDSTSSLGLIQNATIGTYPEYSTHTFIDLLDQEIGVKYFDKKELDQREVFPTQDGRFLRADGSQVKASKKDEEQIYVMDKNGRIFVDYSENGKIHHSSFLAGQPISAGGTIDFDASGRLTKVDNATGHYKAHPESTLGFLSELNRRRVSVPKVEVGMTDSSGRSTHETLEVVRKSFPNVFSVFQTKPNNTEIEKKVGEIRSTRQRLKRQYKSSLAAEKQISDLPAGKEKEKLLPTKKILSGQLAEIQQEYLVLTEKEKKLLVRRNEYYHNYLKKHKSSFTRPVRSTCLTGSCPKPKPKPKTTKTKIKNKK